MAPILRSLAAGLILALAAGTSVSAMDTSGGDAFGTPTTSDLLKQARKSVDMQRYREAIGDLEKVVKDQPKNADALNLLGYSHRKLSEYDLSVSYYQKALAADPKHRGANEYLGEAYLELNKLPEAEARLAELNQICGTGCKEYQALAAAVAQYKAGKRPPQSSRANW
jgi:tetratricopeptide (TPR) repeat protein